MQCVRLPLSTTISTPTPTRSHPRPDFPFLLFFGGGGGGEYGGGEAGVVSDTLNGSMDRSRTFLFLIRSAADRHRG